ncbi:farnesyltransferase, putative [Trypanosoma brucei gambiense DAL972]|uniref:squalene synthase n=1 Tax=Trypanosoma brucei gambiense (strain MHOM/CI/86/DAL972) TaxID=679716 RepID=C9ZWK5_TRYB9|nr:farnesyltransferase, putative [Trypanosoma brucei gambiense DAL972]CBH13794.1 farnesyltransferase, putative [Trypanosoma brucei gambiense DAL972]|eukprot:XP_011776070.1 farnesyltransferase, putative [Trypanosoma brucei gambiense DAL972]
MDYVSELYAMIRVRWQMRRMAGELQADDEDLRFCYDVLRDVSRSFALVIMQLKAALRDAVCVFYLVLRALDTVEDDMQLPLEFKLRELPLFHTRLHDHTWRLDGVGEGRERELLQKFPHVSAAFSRLDPSFQSVIEDICRRMADGMCDFLQRTDTCKANNKEISEDNCHDGKSEKSAVETREDFDLYCHYVAGLVGLGLTQLFVRSGLEKAALEENMTRANHMGLLLQKTNIIRDFYEDICESPPRVFWPREIWGQYTDDLHAFKGITRPTNGSNDTACGEGRKYSDEEKEIIKSKAVDCLNAMVADALVHLPPVIEYLAELRDPTVFAFCAIPQVMAVATLALVFDNPDVFHSRVKLTRGATCKIIHNATELSAALKLVRTYAQKLLSNAHAGVASHEAVAQSLQVAIKTMDEQVLRHNTKLVEGPTRRVLAQYSALGGGLLLKVVDGVFGYLGR